MKLTNFFRKFFVLIDLYRIDLDNCNRFKEGVFDNYSTIIINDISDMSKLQPIIKERGITFNNIVEERLLSGNFICFCFIDNSTGKPAYSRWLKTGSFFHDRYKKRIELKNNEAFTLDSYTLYEFRGKGLHKEMNKRMLNYCKENLRIMSVYMVIFRGKQYRHLHMIVKDIGYILVQSNFYLSPAPLIGVLNMIAK